MLGRKSGGSMNRAGMHAMRRMHEYVTVEHLLFSLLEENRIWDILVALGANYESIKTEIEHYLDQDVPKARKIADQSTPDSDEPTVEPPAATLGLQRLVQRSIFHCAILRKRGSETRRFLCCAISSEELDCPACS